MLRELEQPDFPENFLYLKEEVNALPEQENYEPYHENDFMFIFSNDSHEKHVNAIKHIQYRIYKN